ncbi:MAG: Crp/Fnr family transcriptional regulator [bacterium]
MEERAEGIVQLLAGVPLFSSLSADELKQVAALAIPRRFPADTRVFSEGDDGGTCFVLKSGSCRVTREHRDGRAITLANLGPGAVFGEMSLFDQGTRSATVETADAVELLAIPATDMRSLLRQYPELAEKMVVALAERLRAANERLASQSFQTVPARVSAALIQALSTPEASAGGTSEPVTLSMRQADLAQLAGTSRESVSRFIAGLEREGVVKVGRGRLTILRPEDLQNYVP